MTACQKALGLWGKDAARGGFPETQTGPCPCPWGVHAGVYSAMGRRWPPGLVGLGSGGWGWQSRQQGQLPSRPQWGVPMSSKHLGAAGGGGGGGRCVHNQQGLVSPWKDFGVFPE